MNQKNLFPVVLVLLAGMLLAGCNPAEPVVDIQVEPVSTDADPGAAVLPDLLPIARAIVNGSITERVELVQFLTTGCTFADGLGGPPKCEEGQEEGHQVEVFPVGGAEGGIATRETIEQAFEFGVIGLSGVYAVPADAYREDFWPAGDYALVFDRTQNEMPMPISVLVADGKIVRLQYHFGTPVEDLLNGIPVDQIVVPPTQVEAWLAGSQP